MPLPARTQEGTQPLECTRTFIVRSNPLSDFLGEHFYHGVNNRRLALKMVVEAALGNAHFRNQAVEAGRVIAALADQFPGSSNNLLAALDVACGSVHGLRLK